MNKIFTVVVAFAVAIVSITSYVTADDEWIAEAYLETDYSSLSKLDFEHQIRNFAMFKMVNSENDD